MRQFVIGENDSEQRIDKFLLKMAPELPKSLLYKAIRKKDIKRNRKRCTGEEILLAGDVLDVYLPDVFFEREKKVPHVLSFPQILYENTNVLALLKPAGLLSHSDEHAPQDTLVDRVKFYLYKTGQYNPLSEQSFAPALCSRLDRYTSGIVLAAKNARAVRALNEGIREGKVARYYLALLDGTLPKQRDIVEGCFVKDVGANKMFSSKEGVKTRTGYEVLAEDSAVTLARLQLFTGRTHQLRAQMAVLGAPILGDKKYGGRRVDGFSSQALHASEVVFSFEEKNLLHDLNEIKISSSPSWDNSRYQKLLAKYKK